VFFVSHPFFWNGLGAIGSIITALVVAMGAVFTVRQVREAARARRLESARAILQEISSADIRRARRLAFTKFDAIRNRFSEPTSSEQADKFFKKISNGKVDFECFHTYCASLENIAILVMHDLAPDDVVAMYLEGIAAHHWRCLGSYVRWQREQYKSDDFLQHFEMLVKLLKEDGLRLRGQLRQGAKERQLWRWRNRKSWFQPTRWNPSLYKKRSLLRERWDLREPRNKQALAGLNDWYHTETWQATESVAPKPPCGD
jgi:hypothetical protein